MEKAFPERASFTWQCFCVEDAELFIKKHILYLLKILLAFFSLLLNSLGLIFFFKKKKPQHISKHGSMLYTSVWLNHFTVILVWITNKWCCVPLKSKMKISSPGLTLFCRTCHRQHNQKDDRWIDILHGSFCKLSC